MLYLAVTCSLCIYVEYALLFVYVELWQRWTAGKRKAEKDEFIGERLFFTVEPHIEPMPARFP